MWSADDECLFLVTQPPPAGLSPHRGTAPSHQQPAQGNLRLIQGLEGGFGKGRSGDGSWVFETQVGVDIDRSTERLQGSSTGLNVLPRIPHFFPTVRLGDRPPTALFFV